MARISPAGNPMRQAGVLDCGSGLRSPELGVYSEHLADTPAEAIQTIVIRFVLHYIIKAEDEL